MIDSLNETNSLNLLPFFNVANDEELPFGNTFQKDLLDYKLKLFGNENIDTVSPLSDIDPDYNIDCFKDNVANILNQCDFYSEDQFIEMNLNFHKDDFSVYHFNIRSLPAHVDEFMLSLQNIKSSFKIIGLCETWLSDINSYLYNFPKYNVIHKTREGRRGGGVSLLICDSIDYVIRDDLCVMFDEVAESVFIEIDKSYFNTSNNIIIGEIYRPPNTPVNEFNDCLEQFLAHLTSCKSLCYLMGDFNINLQNVNNHEKSSDFLHLLLSYCYVPLISRPTRCCKDSATLIDNIFTNNFQALQDKSKSGVIFQKISDHFPIFLINSFNGEKPGKNNVIYKEIINPTNINRFKDMLIKHQWDDVVNCNDVNHATNLFLDQFNHFYEICFPIKKIIVKENHKPWITQCLLNSIKRKNKLYKAYMKNPCDITKFRYSSYRNKLTHLIRISKKKYYADCLKKHKNNPKKSWKIINEILHHHKITDALPNVFESNNRTIDGHKNIANHLNTYFASVGSELASKISRTSLDPLHYMQPNQGRNFKSHDINEEDLKKVFSGLKNSSGGFDRVRPSVIKSVFDQIKYPLIHLINISFRYGIFPDSLKLAIITPIYKQGNKKLASNYRPISVLSVFSKIFEKLMYKQLSNYLNCNNILYIHQYGFQEGYSTDHALITVTNYIYKAFNDKEQAIAVSIDLKKAFDTIDHSILLRKLSHYGIKNNSLSWFASYLQNRHQKVKFKNNVFSDYGIMKCGVPQGSTLGPLLFLLYLNDLPFVSKVLTFVLFADDTNIFLKGNNISELMKTFNIELINISDWFAANKLSLNVQKTNCIHFSNGNYKTDIKLKLNGKEIKQVQEIKFLGVFIDDKLTWKSHIQYINTKISKSIGILYKVRHILNKEWKMNLYKTFVVPYLNYCNIIWASTYKTSLNTLLIKQKRALKIVLNLPFLTPSAYVFNIAKVHTVYEINKMHFSIFMYKYVKKLLPLSFTNMFILNRDIHSIQTRNSSKFYVPFPRIDKFKFSVTYAAPTIWNSLSEINKNLDTIHKFKNNIKQYMLTHRII